jgi:hypothetical protein
VTRRPLHLTVILIAAAAMLPAAALAARPKHHHKFPTNCQSAVCVYYENGFSPNGNAGSKALQLSAQALAALNRYGGKDKRTLLAIATSPTFGVAPAPGGPFGDSNSPGMLDALDLGAGPLALFGVLFAGAAAYAGGRWLRRRRAAAA